MMKKYCMIFTILLSLLLLSLACEDNPFDPNGWSAKSHEGFVLKWRVQGSNLEAELKGPSTGWIAVGFAGSYMMHDSNIIIGYVSGSSVSIRDDFGIDSNTHVSDSDLQGGEQNVSDKSGSEGSGTTTIYFTIPLDSGDLYDNALSEGQSYNIVFACSADGADNFTSAYKTITNTSITI
ncbi:MAG: hypothetical protein GQ565_11555 [Candidatus Aegiribacteria sp.]|nr:hypothetical protein [Candidatus Aegiribacteria sp.]